VEASIEQLAGELGVSVVRRFQGGEFGATLVTTSAGAQLVLKADPFA
jgi:hypothetical protein